MKSRVNVRPKVPKFSVLALDLAADRAKFTCGIEPLDRYFRTQVSQDIKRRVSACFVANDNMGQIAGYYTLASASILLSDLPETLAKKLPRYPSVPAVRMGRLAVSDSFKGKGLGAALLADALRRAATAEVAACASQAVASSICMCACDIQLNRQMTLASKCQAQTYAATVKRLP